MVVQIHRTALVQICFRFLNCGVFSLEENMPYQNSEKQKQCQKDYYIKNKKLYLDLQRKRKKERRAWFSAIKAKLKCMLCSESDSVCLDFHHRDRSAKIKSVCQLVAEVSTEEKILNEMAKCDVVCANCHRKLHRDLWAV